MGKKKLVNHQEPQSPISQYNSAFVQDTDGDYRRHDQPPQDSLCDVPASHENEMLHQNHTNAATQKRRHKKPPSMSLLKELPSRNLDTVVDDFGPLDDADTINSKASSPPASRSATMRRANAKFATLRLRSGNVSHFRKATDADRVYEILTQDTEMSLDEMKETLRDMNQCLTLKREVSQRLSKSEGRHARHLSMMKWLKYTTGMGFQQLKFSLQEILYSFDLWRYYLKIIQGHFGNGIASYFLFLRWLFLLNCFLFIVVFSFVVIPQILWDWKKNKNSQTEVFTGQELITGTGYFTDTTLYYGHYTEEKITLDDAHFYDMPLAYFLTMAVSLILSLITVSYSLAKSYRENYVETSGDLKNVFANKVFCAWDFSIETTKAAQLKSRSIYNELKDLLSRQKREEASFSFKYQLQLFLIRLVINIFIISILCGIGYLTYFFLQKKDEASDDRFVKDMLLSVVVNAIIFIFPVIFPILSYFERYLSSQRELYLNMFRIVLLKIVVLGMVVYFWMFHNKPSKESLCWETNLGQEVYRLFVIHFIFVILYSLVTEFIHNLLAKQWKQSFKKPEFDIARNILDLVYAQTLFWVGLFFSPLLSFVTVVKLYIIFHSKRWSLMLNCNPASKSWKAAQMQTMFLVLMLLNFILAATAVVVTVFYRQPSRSCGPFRNETTAHYDVILSQIYSVDSEKILPQVFKYVLAPPCVFGYLTVMCIIIYNMRASANARKVMVNLLRDQVTMEGKDKAYLLRLYDMVVEQRKLSSAAAVTDDGKPEVANIVPVNDPRGSLPEGPPNSNEQSKPIGIVNEHYRDHSLHWSERGMSEDSMSFTGVTPGYMPAEVPVNRIQGSRKIPKAGWRVRRSSESVHSFDAPSEPQRWNSLESLKRTQRYADGEDSNYGWRYSDESSQQSDRNQYGHPSQGLRYTESDRQRHPSESHSDTESSASAYRELRFRKEPNESNPKYKFPPLPQPTHQLGFQYLTRGDSGSPSFMPRSLRSSYSPGRDSPGNKYANKD